MAAGATMRTTKLADRQGFHGWLLLIGITWSAVARGVEVNVPLQLDYALVRHILWAEVFTGPDHSARVLDDGRDCNVLVLSDPAIATDAGRIKLTSKARAKLGNLEEGGCFSLLRWDGIVELLEQPVLAPDLSTIRFHIVDSRIYDRDGSRPVLTGLLWDSVKRHVHPQLQKIRVDLGSPVREIRSLVPLLFSGEGADAVRRSLDSLAITDVRAVERGLAMTLRFNVPAMPRPPAAQPSEPPLTSDEAQKWEAALQEWDAFLTFVIRQSAKETELREVRRALLGVLLEGRYDLVDALTTWQPGTPDPVRRLFLKSWRRLAPLLRQLSITVPGAEAGRYLGFIAAADALEALDRLGEQMDFEISADGLRRLARTLTPQYAEDPLAHTLEVDPELRQLFGFGPPLPLPEITPTIEPGSWLPIPEAHAARGPSAAIVKRLNRWIPKRDEVHAYLPLVRDLLKQSAAAAMEGGELDGNVRKVYPFLSLATAWQESCWRQFVRRGGKVQPLLSSAGAIGIMQVNPRVWRGFYDRDALRRDIGYNAYAGNEILLRYLVEYVMAGIEGRGRHDIENIVRASYAVYHGGPGHIDRYRKKNARKSLRAIDRAFWAKYRMLQRDELAVARCFDIEIGDGSGLLPILPQALSQPLGNVVDLLFANRMRHWIYVPGKGVSLLFQGGAGLPCERQGHDGIGRAVGQQDRQRGAGGVAAGAFFGQWQPGGQTDRPRQTPWVKQRRVQGDHAALGESGQYDAFLGHARGHFALDQRTDLGA